MCILIRLDRTNSSVTLKNATNFKLPQILKCHNFQSATNVPCYFYFYSTNVLESSNSMRYPQNREKAVEEEQFWV